MTATRDYSDSDLRLAFAHALDAFGERPEVTGIDIGFRWLNGRATRDRTVRIHVTEKRALGDVPPAERFPLEVKGVRLDVVEGPYRIQRLERGGGNRRRFDRALAGISAGTIGISTGTIGAIVIDRATGTPGILSNWHILVGADGAPGGEIVQPGPCDGGASPADRIAEAGPSVLGEDGDAAVGWLTGERDWLPFVYGVDLMLEGARYCRLGETLAKSGRSTGVTEAQVDGEGIYFFHYAEGAEGSRRVGIRGFRLSPPNPSPLGNAALASAGDSGATWFDRRTRMAVGLHVAGAAGADPRQEHAIACHMPTVLDRLGVRLASIDDIAPDLAAAEAPVISLPEPARGPAPATGFDEAPATFAGVEVAEAVIAAYRRGLRDAGVPSSVAAYAFQAEFGAEPGADYDWRDCAPVADPAPEIDLQEQVAGDVFGVLRERFYSGDACWLARMLSEHFPTGPAWASAAEALVAEIAMLRPDYAPLALEERTRDALHGRTVEELYYALLNRLDAVVAR